MESGRGDPYSLLDDLTGAPSPHPLGGFAQLVAARACVSNSDMWSEFERRHDTIRRFQQISMDLFRMALAQELEPEVGRVLLNDALGSWREEFHRRLLEPHWTLPCYFRTDEAAPGQIVEI